MDPLKFMLVGGVGLAIVRGLTRTWSSRERSVAALALTAHLVSAIAQEVIYRFVYGGGDMMVYQWYGSMIADLIVSDPAGYLPEALKLLFQQEHGLPFRVIGSGSSTGSMSGLASLLTVLVGNELYVMGAVVGVASAAGLMLIHADLRDEVPEHLHVRTAIALMLLPSVVFWTSAVLKESVIMLPIGLTTRGLVEIVRKRRVARGLLLVVIGGTGIALFKPYVLAGFFAGFPAFYLSHRAQLKNVPFRISPSKAILAGIGTALFLFGFGRLFEQYDVADLGTQLSTEQQNTLRSAGGSSYQLVSTESTSLASQLAFTPLAIFTTLFRPLIFEAHNAQALVNAAEATLLFLFFARGALQRRFGDVLRFVLDRPVLVLTQSYALVLAVGVGLATTNLGTLSRYRVPMYAHFAVVCVLLVSNLRSTRSVTAQTAQLELAPATPPLPRAAATGSRAVESILRQRMPDQ
jgi:hypothetical protein